MPLFVAPHEFAVDVHDSPAVETQPSTVTAVHGPQLLLSFDSGTSSAVSAQARRYFIVPISIVGNMYEMETFVLPNTRIDPTATVPIGEYEVPLASFAFWKRVWEGPAATLFRLAIIDENVVASTVEPDVGLMPPALRSGVVPGTPATSTGVHGPQLLSLFDSGTTFVVSAQARIYLVVPASDEGNVYGMVADVLPDLAMEAVNTVPIGENPEPLASFAFWKSV